MAAKFNQISFKNKVQTIIISRHKYVSLLSNPYRSLTVSVALVYIFDSEVFPYFRLV